MARFRFVHASDLLLDSPFTGLVCRSERVREALVNASLAAFDRLVDYAIAKDAAFVLFSGRLYEGPRRGVRAQARLLSGFRKLSDCGIEVFCFDQAMAPVFAQWVATQRLPKGVKLFRSGSEEIFPVVREGEHLASLRSALHRHDDTVESFQNRHRARSSGVNIGVLQMPLDGRPLDLSQLLFLKETTVDYWGLGGIPRRKMLSEKSPYIVFPGTLQGRGFGSGDVGPKGAALVEVEADKILKVSFVPLDAVRTLVVDMDIQKLSTLEDLRESVEREREKLLRNNQGVSIVARLNLCGEGALHGQLRTGAALGTFLASLQQTSEAGSRFFHWEAAPLQTFAPLNRDAVARRGDLTAEVVLLANRYHAQTEEFEALLGEWLSPLKTGDLGLLLPEGEGGGGASMTARPLLLRRAEQVALEHFEHEETP